MTQDGLGLQRTLHDRGDSACQCPGDGPCSSSLPFPTEVESVFVEPRCTSWTASG